eukprot:3866271-Rhodomonas_salina.2
MAVGQHHCLHQAADSRAGVVGHELEGAKRGERKHAAASDGCNACNPRASDSFFANERYGITLFGFTHPERERHFSERCYLPSACAQFSWLPMACIVPIQLFALAHHLFLGNRTGIGLLQLMKCLTISFQVYRLWCATSCAPKKSLERSFLAAGVIITPWLVPAMHSIEAVTELFTLDKMRFNMVCWAVLGPVLSSATSIGVASQLLAFWSPLLLRLLLDSFADDSTLRKGGPNLEIFQLAAMCTCMGPVWCAWLQRYKREDWYESQCKVCAGTGWKKGKPVPGIKEEGMKKKCVGRHFTRTPSWRSVKSSFGRGSTSSLDSIAETSLGEEESEMGSECGAECGLEEHEVSPYCYPEWSRKRVGQEDEGDEEDWSTKWWRERAGDTEEDSLCMCSEARTMGSAEEDGRLAQAKTQEEDVCEGGGAKRVSCPAERDSTRQLCTVRV